jgi:hypothetical protein
MLTPTPEVWHQSWWDRAGRPFLASLNGVLWSAVEHTSLKIKPPSHCVQQPLEPLHRLMAGASVYAHQNERGQMPVDAKMVALGVLTEPECCPQ